jgi:hypothetical protein
MKNIIKPILVVDFENAGFPKQYLPNLLDHFESIYFVLFHTHAKIDVNLLVDLAPHIQSKRINFIRVPSGGKNASDIGIAFLAGYLINHQNTDEILLISKDGIFKNVIGVAQQFNLNVHSFMDYDSAISFSNRADSGVLPLEYSSKTEPEPCNPN